MVHSTLESQTKKPKPTINQFADDFVRFYCHSIIKWWDFQLPDLVCLRLPELYRYFNTRCAPPKQAAIFWQIPCYKRENLQTEGNAAISKTFRIFLAKELWRIFFLLKNLTAKCGGEKTNGLLAEGRKYLVQVGELRDHVVILSANWSLRECHFFCWIGAIVFHAWWYCWWLCSKHLKLVVYPNVSYILVGSIRNNIIKVERLKNHILEDVMWVCLKVGAGAFSINPQDLWIYPMTAVSGCFQKSTNGTFRIHKINGFPLHGWMKP